MRATLQSNRGQEIGRAGTSAGGGSVFRFAHSYGPCLSELAASPADRKETHEQTEWRTEGRDTCSGLHARESAPGELTSLSDFQEKPVILAFYPDYIDKHPEYAELVAPEG